MDSIKGSNVIHVPVGNLISLSDSPQPPVAPTKKVDNNAKNHEEDCPTGLLIDMSDAIQVPFTQELLRVGEFDDTFGLFNNQNASKPKPEEQIPEPPAAVASTSDDSDNSLLDINNLSSFSISDTGEDFLDRMNISDISISTIASTKSEPAHRIEYLVDRDQLRDDNQKLIRRDSFSRKLKRLSVLMSSPISSPPSSNRYLPTPGSYNLSTKIENSTSKPSINSINDAKCPFNNELEDVPVTHKFSTPLARNIKTSDSSIMLPPASNTPLFRKLSFESVTSTESSPPNINELRLTQPKQEPIFGLIKDRVSGFPIKPIASVRGAPQHQNPVRSANKPLKAIGRLPSSLNGPIMEGKTLVTSPQKRAVCASAPVTRKFPVPPSPGPPPSPSSNFNRSYSLTPSRRKSLNAVSSSGYGQQSPKAIVPRSKVLMISPAKVAKTLTGPQKPPRPAMGAREQLNVSLTDTRKLSEATNNPSVIVKGQVKMDTSSGFRRYGQKPISSSTKENRPNLNCSLLQPGFANNVNKYA